MPNNQTQNIRNKACFVCGQYLDDSDLTVNTRVSLYVCHKCKNSAAEIQKEREHLECLGSGFGVGCIS